VSVSATALCQTGSFWVVDIFGNRAIFYPLNGLVDDEQWDKEPLARDHRISKTVLDLDIKPRRIEDAVDEVFELRPVDIGPSACSQEESRRVRWRLHLGQKPSVSQS
jgi:hypothetical protein